MHAKKTPTLACGEGHVDVVSRGREKLHGRAGEVFDIEFGGREESVSVSISSYCQGPGAHIALSFAGSVSASQTTVMKAPAWQHDLALRCLIDGTASPTASSIAAKQSMSPGESCNFALLQAPAVVQG